MGDQARKLMTTSAMVLLCVLSLSAQLELISDPVAVKARVVQDLDTHVASEDWAKFLKKNPIKGMFTYDITLWNKGEVVSITAIDRSESASIEDQNTLKNYVKGMRFDFKVPKGKRYKVTYNFKIE